LKTKQSITLAAIFALCTLAFAACGGAANTNNANNANGAANANANSTANRNASSSTSSATGDYSTPTSAFKTFYESAKANDTAGMKRAMSKKTMEVMEKGAAKENKSIDDVFKEMNKDTPATVPEMRNEKINGDKATLEIKDSKMDKWDTVPFVKEDGQWKIALLDEMAAAMDKLESVAPDNK
jgi:hypothetical protein